MKIDKIILGEKEYEVDEKINIISGYTKANKTVLFYAIEYLFCIDSSLEINKAKTVFNCNSIKMIFKEDKKILKVERMFDEKFNAIIDDEQFDSKASYQKELALKFNFDQIYIENNNQKNKFYLKDYLKLIMIPEEQLTSVKNIFERNGELDINKLIAFFTYMITGKVMKKELVDKKTRTSKSTTQINQFVTTFNRIYSKPKKSEINKYNEATTKMDDLNNEIANIEKLLTNLSEQKKELEISNLRLNTLIKSYEEDMKCFKFAKFFEKIEEEVSEEVDLIDYEYYSSLKNSINDIKKLYNENTNKISKLCKQLLLHNEEKDNLMQKVIGNKETIASLKKVEQYNQMLLLTSNMTVDNNKIFDDIVNEIEQYKNTVKNDFKNNLSILCSEIKNRLTLWGINDINEVSFNNRTYDFEFDSTPIKFQPKGEKSIFSLAVNIEIILFMKSIGIIVPNFILIDSCWVATDLRDMKPEQIKTNIVNNLAKLDLQVIIFENEDRKERIENCNYIFLCQ